MLSGSIAMSIYTIPRATRDIDIVVHLKKEDIEAVTNYFKGPYYCDSESVKKAVESGGMFNIIDHESGFKADFIVLKNQAYRQTEFKRRQEVEFLDMHVYIASPEDILLSKMIWIQEIQSSIQMEDIRNLSEIENLDWNYINFWVGSLKINNFNLF